METEQHAESFRLAVSGQTHVGLKRQDNQDRILITDVIQAVADGMGGHEAGEVASQLAVETLEELNTFSFKTVVPRLPTVEQIQRQIQLIDDRIRDALESRGGTTLCALALVRSSGPGQDQISQPMVVPPWTGSFKMSQNTDVLSKITPEMLAEHRARTEKVSAETQSTGEYTSLLLVNVGDSRGYRLRGQELRQLTRDHSAVQEMVDAGQITEAEARSHPHRNLITRALGAGADSQPDLTVLQPRIGDRYLLCSDGLSGELTEMNIQELLINHPDRQEATQVLTQAALEAGGRDNIAVVVIDVLPDTGS
ncbi:PP2C family protein-serine/threonine phosphatase [Glutamicibacter sp. 287]|uniref:PP2C family protein-serine/threonine phosphatase n=1 Tax=unclassified Glutamicibacter TaxID=2627139 RepID=UPI000BB68F9D|nr:serine/threonine-protein phosphatase [Glutamicibacter sp. BW80]PCC27994.1 hypothetical protein CIK76_14110 [Glutamicibacter sp. BW80]